MTPIRVLSTNPSLLPFPSMLISPMARIHDGKQIGVLFTGAGTIGRIDCCEIFGHTAEPPYDAGVYIKDGASPSSISSCTIRDNGVGIFVNSSSRGAAPGMESSNTFARNQNGGITRR